MFIELTSIAGRKIIVNLDHVVAITFTRDECQFHHARPLVLEEKHFTFPASQVRERLRAIGVFVRERAPLASDCEKIAEVKASQESPFQE